MKSLRAQTGFTLIEILVATTIMAIISGLLYSALGDSVKNQEALKQSQERINKVHLAMVTMERDFIQMAPRAIRKHLGGSYPALQTLEGGVEFTRTGRPMIFNHRLSTFMRVAYVLEDDKLIRKAWSVLDRPSFLESQSIVLLTKVSAFAVSFRFEKKWIVAWPPNKTSGQFASGSEASASVELPSFIRIDIDAEGFGALNRILPVANE